MKLYFTRHGESEANVQEIFWNRPEGYGLTDTGRAQAHALVDNLAGVTFAALYCSPVLRAVQTAEILGRGLDLSPQIEDGLREWDVGVIDGQPYNDETRARYREVTQQWFDRGNPDARIEGGESYKDVAARFRPFVDRLEKLHAGTAANILLVSHGGTLMCMLPLLLSNVDTAFALRHGCPYATPIIAELRDGEWICLRWGEAVWEGGWQAQE
jgi:probable phosphoglycerate mutase